MIVEIDASSPVPPYEQIRAQIATMIGSGVLPADTRLPPIRQLAADLGLATNTVARAYRELEARGLVASRVRHGTRVTAGRKPAAPAENRQRLGAAARTYLAVAYQLGLSAEDAAQALRAATDSG